MSEVESTEELIVYIARCLVDDPEAVRVNTVEDGEVVGFELTVGPGDLGKVIGKDGRTARALRTVVSASAAKYRCRTLLQIVE